ncbi:MAG: hypothetical protein R6U13_15270, partial [Desulfatiglandaceae bacterium]
CRGGCSSGKMSVFIFRDGYPHRHSPMSFLIPVFLAFLCVSASWREANILSILSILSKILNPAPQAFPSKTADTDADADTD